MITQNCWLTTFSPTLLPPPPHLPFDSPCKSRSINFSHICNILSKISQHPRAYSPDRVELVILILILYRFNIQSVKIILLSSWKVKFSAFFLHKTLPFRKSEFSLLIDYGSRKCICRDISLLLTIESDLFTCCFSPWFYFELIFFKLLLNCDRRETVVHSSFMSIQFLCCGFEISLAGKVLLADGSTGLG